MRTSRKNTPSTRKNYAAVKYLRSFRIRDIHIVAFIAILIRLILYTIFKNPKYYYPDSWDYVVVPSQPGPPSSFHPPTVWYFWKLITLNSPNESHVLVAQAVLGVFGTLLLYKSFTSICSRPTANLMIAGY